ncbi:MAG: GDP-mannose 4,6 dehydratase, partial [Deltaproteobacteria bacterium]
TGEQHSVREFVELAARELGIEITWKGKGINETGVITRTTAVRSSSLSTELCRPGRVIVRVDPAYFRPTEVSTLLGDSSKAREKLGWQCTVGFEDLVSEMVRSDLEEAKRDQLCLREGFTTYNNFE